MKRIQIAPGIEMTDIAMGESRRGYPDCEQSAFEVMDRYVELGGNTFDSARLYSDGAADRALGKWIKSRGLRDSLTVVTKGSHPDRKNMFASRLTRRDIEGDLDESLAFMGLAYSDLHLLHRDDVRIPVEEIMPSLDALVRAGKTRAVGVSNWTAARIIEANQFALENVLPGTHPLLPAPFQPGADHRRRDRRYYACADERCGVQLVSGEPASGDVLRRAWARLVRRPRPRRGAEGKAQALL